MDKIALKKLKARIDERTDRILWKMKSAEIGRFPNSDIELRREVVRESVWTQDDVDKVKENLGQTKKKRFERLMPRKVKDN